MIGIKDVVAKNLKINRMKMGLTQEKLAEKAEISTHYLAMIELGHHYPSANMVERLATVLEIEPYELFFVPTTAEKGLERLQESVLSYIERAVHNAVKESLKNEKSDGKNA